MSVTLDINTLKSAGFEIISGNKSNNYCYELKLIPIKIKFTKKEIRVLLGTKKALFQFMDFRYIISLYEVFEKISKLIESDEQAESLLNFGNILRTNFKILKELDVHCKHKNEIVVFYASPSGKKREMTLRCEKIEYSNDQYTINSVVETIDRLVHNTMDIVGAEMILSAEAIRLGREENGKIYYKYLDFNVKNM